MAAEFNLFREDYRAGGILIACMENRNDYAEMTYLDMGQNRWVVDEILVGDDLKGTPVIETLANEIVAAARANNVTLIPFCRVFRCECYARPDWQDVVEMPSQRAATQSIN